VSSATPACPYRGKTGSRLANHANSVRVQHSLKQVALDTAPQRQYSKAALIDASVYDRIQSSLLEQWTLHLRAGLRLEDALRFLAQQISFSPSRPQEPYRPNQRYEI